MNRLLCVLLVLFAASRAAAQPEGLDIPAIGVIDLDEGTCEMWVRFDVAPAAVEQRYLSQGELLRLQFDPAIRNRAMSLGAAVWQQKLVTRIGISVGEGEPNGIPFWGEMDQQRGRWFHVALVWRDGNQLAWFYNGRPTAERSLDVRFDLPLARDAVLSLMGRGRAQFALDELRVSSIARRPESLGFHGPLKPDAATTLLLTFDASDDGLLHPLAATTEASKPLPLPRGFALVDSPFGNALAPLETDR